MEIAKVLNLERRRGTCQEEEPEEEETTLQVRKPRSAKDGQNTELSVLDSEMPDEICDSDGPEFKSMMSSNGGAKPMSENEQPKKGYPCWVVDNEGLTMKNGLQQEENLIFYDEYKGIWRCRICSWIYQNGSVCVDHVQNHKVQHKPMNGKMLESETNGIEVTPAYSGELIENACEDNKYEVLSKEFIEPRNFTFIKKQGSEGQLEDGSLSNSHIRSIRISEADGFSGSVLQQPSQIRHGPSRNIESKEVYLISGDEIDVLELDAEQVLQNQATHDLYCPNCNSCITRRVILRKRKRRIRVSEGDIKHYKVETLAGSELNAGSLQASNEQAYPTNDVSVGGALMLTKDGLGHDRAPDLFRCLSCFSLFIPTRNGFKIFKLFGEEKVDLNVHDEQVASMKENWFAPMFGFNKQDKSVEQGDTVEHFDEPFKQSEIGAEAQTNHETDLSVKTLPKRTPITVGESAEDVISLSQQGGFKLLVSSSEELETDDGAEGGPSSHQKIEISTAHTGKPLQIGNVASTVQNTRGKETIITVDARSVGSSQQGIIISVETEISSLRVAEHVQPEVRNEFEVEVVKSVVYGGLIESIASLGVVSSAAGGDATTLSTLALGMANVIGGLSIISHNLWELRNDCTNQISSPAIEQRDRYTELLGRKENFKLHAIVSVLSYLMSGLLPVIVYGFSFRKSDNKELKLLMVSIVSILCIVALAIGRAYVRQAPKPYFKSVATYVIMGVLVSGVSYVAGILVETMLEKLGLFARENILLTGMGTETRTRTKSSLIEWTY